MYPKNAASPERIAIGAVVQISDGAVQTSGVSISVKPQGNAASAGGGTTTYEQGIVEYVPTQAETNYTSFTVIAYKTGCIPVSQTIITSSSSVAGTVMLANLAQTILSLAITDGLAVSRSTSNTSAITATGNGTGHGISAVSGSGATGNGINASAASTNGNGISAAGSGTGAGELMTGGATGNGLKVVGGGTSGDGVAITATSGHGINTAGTGTTKHGVHAAGGATTSHGINAVGGGVGHGILATSGGGSTGDGIKAVAASTNGNGLNVAGVGTGAGTLTTGGATGIGLSAVGGATSGDGIKSVTTSGHGLNLAPVGTNMHGLLATGGNGGTSDGIKAAAGTGGVDLRAAITGNITGNLSGSVGSLTGHTVQTGDAYARLGAPAGASVSADIAAVKTQTAAIEVDTGTDLPATLVTIGGYIDTEVAAIYSRIGAPVGASISADIAAVKAETATVLSDTNDIQTRLPAALVSGRMDSSVGAMAADVVTAAAIAAGAIDRATFADDTGLKSIRSNTAQAGASTSITLDASASSVTDFYKNALIVLTGGTGAGQGRYCTAYNGTTKVATVSAWATNPDNTSTFAVIAADAIVGATAPTAAQVADEVQTRTIAAVTLVNGLAANTVNASALASDAVTEIQSGLATAANLATVAGYIDTEVAAILVDTAAIKAKTDNLPSDPADASDVAGAFTTVNTKLDTIDDFLDTEVAAIKAKTDNLPSDPADASVVAGLIAAVETKVDDLPTNAELATALGTADDAVLAAIADKTGYRLSSTGVNDILRTALTEGYAADGATFTLEQALYMLWALAAERAIVSTTLTARKLDGSTSAMTFTLDDDVAPTTQTRAS
jgi:hypothetical protein